MEEEKQEWHGMQVPRKNCGLRPRSWVPAPNPCVKNGLLRQINHELIPFAMGPVNLGLTSVHCCRSSLSMKCAFQKVHI